MLKVLHIADKKSYRYRRVLLGELLEKDDRFSYISYEDNITDFNSFYEAVKNENIDVVIVSSPKHVSLVSATKLCENFNVVFDYSDNWMWVPHTRAFIKKSKFIGTSSLGLKNKAESVSTKNIPINYYPNGCYMDYAYNGKSIYNNKYIYAGQIYKLDIEYLNEILKRDNAHLDIYNLYNKSTYDISKVLDEDHITIYDELNRENLLKKMEEYEGCIIAFQDIPACTLGMLPLKFFDCMMLHKPVYFHNCGELENKDFSKVAFNLQNYELGSQRPKDSDYEEIITKYQMEKSLKNFIDDIYEAFK